MNKLLSSIMVAVMGVGFAAGALAADTSSTVSIRKSIVPVGSAPQIGYVKVTLTAASVSTGLTFDVPVPAGMTSSNIVDVLGVAQTVSGSTKPLLITRSGVTVTVSGTNMSSGTLVSGDVVKAIVIYQP